MESRPYIKLKGKELVEVFQSCNGEHKILKALRAELAHRRKPPSMRDLLGKVEEQLARIGKFASTKATAVTAKPSDQMHLSLPDVPNQPAKGPQIPTAPLHGKIGSIRPCGVIHGVPSRRVFPDTRNFELKIGKNASRIEKFVVALRALVKDMRKRGGGMRTVTLEHGKAVVLDGRERGYRFPYDGDAELFEGAKVTIAIGSRTCDGRIVSVSSQWLIVSFDEDLGPVIGACVLRIDNTAMIDALADQLDKVRNGQATLNLPLADDVLDNSGDQIRPNPVEKGPKSYSNLNLRQKAVVEHVIANAVTYLWGPPGTGKTFSLSAINEILFTAGKRILICSNTNQAVDQVLVKLCESWGTSHAVLDSGKGNCSRPLALLFHAAFGIGFASRVRRMASMARIDLRRAVSMTDLMFA